MLTGSVLIVQLSLPILLRTPIQHRRYCYHGNTIEFDPLVTDLLFTDTLVTDLFVTHMFVSDVFVTHLFVSDVLDKILSNALSIFTGDTESILESLTAV